MSLYTQRMFMMECYENASKMTKVHKAILVTIFTFGILYAYTPKQYYTRDRATEGANAADRVCDINTIAHNRKIIYTYIAEQVRRCNARASRSLQAYVQ